MTKPKLISLKEEARKYACDDDFQIRASESQNSTVMTRINDARDNAN